MTAQATTPPAAGATLHLGGDAYAHETLADRLVPIDTITPYPGNPRRGDQDAITSSIRDLGLYTGVVVQRSTGHILVGNHRRHGLIELGANRIPVDFLDVSDTRAAAIVARDNRTSDQGSYDDAELLALLTAEPEILVLSGYTADDVALLRLLGQEATPEDAGPYTRKADPIQYHPTMETPPPPTELVDRAKANSLVSQIVAAELPTEVRDFLVAGAQRHLVFNYAKIAEFYAHADPDTQALMEASALVIIDYDDAISQGYVRLSDRLTELRGDAITERAARDPRDYADA